MQTPRQLLRPLQPRMVCNPWQHVAIQIVSLFADPAADKQVTNETKQTTACPER